MFKIDSIFILIYAVLVVAYVTSNVFVFKEKVVYFFENPFAGWSEGAKVQYKGRSIVIKNIISPVGIAIVCNKDKKEDSYDKEKLQIRRELLKLKEDTFLIDIIIVCLCLVVFLIFPLHAALSGINRIILIYMVLIEIIVLVGIVLYFKLYKKYGIKYGLKEMFSTILSPFDIVSNKQKITNRLFFNTDPITVSFTVLPKEKRINAYKKYYFEYKRKYKQNGNKDEEIKKIIHLAEISGLTRNELYSLNDIKHPDAAYYCPSCNQQYKKKIEKCVDCECNVLLRVKRGNKNE